MTDTLDHTDTRQPAKRPDPDTLWVTDAELIRRLGVPEKIARQTLREVDRVPASGFPKKDPRWGNRRYWPDVLAYFERRSAKMNPPRRDR